MRLVLGHNKMPVAVRIMPRYVNAALDNEYLLNLFLESPTTALSTRQETIILGHQD